MSEVKLGVTYIEYTVLNIVTRNFFNSFQSLFEFECVFANLRFNVPQQLIRDSKNVFLHNFLKCVELLVVNQVMK